MKKNKSNFRIDIIVIFIILLFGPATGLLLSKTNLLDKIEFLNILRPNADVYEQFALNYEQIECGQLKPDRKQTANLLALQGDFLPLSKSVLWEIGLIFSMFDKK